jgi:hypothetical protein
VSRPAPQLLGSRTLSSASDDDGDRAWWERYRSPRFNPAQRTCIGALCRGRRTFRSEHCGERICPRCKAHSNALYGAFDDALSA